jgi:hypothetical protein
LCARYRRLLRAGKPTNVVTVAIARELAAFAWAIATTVMPPFEPTRRGAAVNSKQRRPIPTIIRLRTAGRGGRSGQPSP